MTKDSRVQQNGRHLLQISNYFHFTVKKNIPIIQKGAYLLVSETTMLPSLFSSQLTSGRTCDCGSEETTCAFHLLCSVIMASGLVKDSHQDARRAFNSLPIKMAFKCIVLDTADVLHLSPIQIDARQNHLKEQQLPVDKAEWQLI